MAISIKTASRCIRYNRNQSVVTPFLIPLYQTTIFHILTSRDKTMKKFLPALIFTASTIIASPNALALPDLDDEDVRDNVDISAFMVGSDGDVGTMFYIVDRTTKNCFSMIKEGNQSSGLTSINCESLNSIPEIEKYMDVGAED